MRHQDPRQRCRRRPHPFDGTRPYNTPVLHPDPSLQEWDELFNSAPPPTWDDLETLLAVAQNAQVTWAEPILIWPNKEDARYALITYDLPDGSRRASLSEDVEFFRPPTDGATWGDVIIWSLFAIREAGECLARTGLALQCLGAEAAGSITAWETERAQLINDQGLDADKQPEDASFLDDDIRPYEKDALPVLRALADLSAGRCPVCQLTDCDTRGEQPIAPCHCGQHHTAHAPSGACRRFRAATR
ncbi:hypothetical protein AB0465_40535 [Streptomyces griseoviridis]|uniref:hypothetical protein n=1 Tax=Streptomyces griseoviridis TaxID=45398 RepID=UPI00344BAD15